MKKYIILFGLLIVASTIMISFIFFRPAIYMWGSSSLEDTLIAAKYSLLSMNSNYRFNQQVKALLILINQDYIQWRDYRDIFTTKDDLSLLSGKVYHVWFYKWFLPVKVSKDCFVFEAEADALSKESGVSLDNFQRASYSSTLNCIDTCKVYLTEKWILSSKDSYSCD